MEMVHIVLRYQDRGGVIRERLSLEVPCDGPLDPEDHPDVQEAAESLASRWTGGAVIVSVSSEDRGGLLSAAEGLGGECASFWDDPIHPPGWVAADPHAWELSDLDVREALMDLSSRFPWLEVDRNDVREALARGFSRRVSEISDERGAS